MKFISINYCLDGDDKKIVNLIKSAHAWLGYFEGNFLILTEQDTNYWTNTLLPFIKDSNGRLLVLEIKINEFNGWLPKEAWDWLKKQQSQIILKTFSR